MANLAKCPNQWDAKTRQCKAIIETPKGRRNKFGYNPDYETFDLKFLLPHGLAFPFDFGFIPSTLAPDGDPLDVMILMEEPAHISCLVDVRIIGVIEAQEAEKGKQVANHRLIGVALRSYAEGEIQSLDEVPGYILDQVEEFFRSYNKLRGKEFQITGRQGPQRAAALVAQAMATFRKGRKRPK
jgi:inorganic pyrophosphatase